VQLRYDDDFIEAAVFLCASGRRRGIAPLQVARFHREREKLYAILDPDERNAAFFKLHLEWFREWKLEKMLTGLLSEYASLYSALNVLAFRKARERTEEGAELYVQNGDGEALKPVSRHAVVALRAERLARDEDLIPFLRHEFMHLHDMLDADFDYSPQLHLSGQNASQQRLTRERYRLLWDVTIDGRLTNSGRATVGDRGQHWAAFERAFGFWPEQRRDEIFGSLWNGQWPRHAELLEIASDPREVKCSHEPLPGAPCPLCGFSTFQWAGAEQIKGDVGRAVLREFPHWTSDQGACGRCVEVYASTLHRSNASLPDL
jgi:hypothetical protein